MPAEMLGALEPAARLPRLDDTNRIAGSVIRPHNRVVFLDDETHRTGMTAISNRTHHNTNDFALAKRVARNALTRCMHWCRAFEAPPLRLPILIDCIDVEPAMRTVVVPVRYSTLDELMLTQVKHCERVVRRYRPHGRYRYERHCSQSR